MIKVNKTTLYLNDNGSEEVCLCGSELQDAAGQGLALVQGRRVDQLVLLQIPEHFPDFNFTIPRICIHK